MGGAYYTGLFLHGLKLCGESRTSEIIELQLYGKKKTPYIALYLTAFFIIVA